MKTFWIRTASATVYAALFLGCILSGRFLGNPTAGALILTGFALFVAIGCTFEFFRMVGLQGAKPNHVLGYAWTALVVLSLGLLVTLGTTEMNYLGAISLGILLIIALLSFAVTLLVQLWRPSEQPFRDIAYTVTPMLYVALPLGLMPMLNYFNVLLMCVVAVWINDAFAYMGGSLVGKHKMWVRHSPGKTWEGTAIGAAFCMAACAIFGPMFECTDFAGYWYEWLVIGAVCSVIGTLGDLAESMLKRSVGVKDSGKIMPGHGGFLDRFDSLLAILPFVLIIVVILK